MASKVEGEKFRDLICPLCLDVFKNATLLGCGHTFCKGCLEAYDEQHDLDYIVCPVCRKKTQLGRDRVAGLTPNYSVKGIEDEVRLDLEVDDSSPNVCSLHKADYKTLFCEVCTEFICITCFINKHQGHKIMKKEEFETELKKTRDALVEKGLVRKNEIEKYARDAEKGLAAMFCHLSNVEKRIRNTCARKRAMLQEDEERLLKQVDNSRKDLDKQLGCRIANNRELIDNIDRSIKGLMGSMIKQFDSVQLEAYQVKCSVLENSLKKGNDKLCSLEKLLAVVKQRVERVHFFPADEKLLALGHLDFGGKVTSVASNVKKASVQSNVQQASVQSNVQQASVQSNVQQASVQSNVYQTSLQGDAQQASLQGDVLEELVQGDVQQASVQSDVLEESVQGDVQQASVQGDVQQESVLVDVHQASLQGDVLEELVQGDVQQALVQSGVQQVSVQRNVQQPLALGNIQQALWNPNSFEQMLMFQSLFQQMTGGISGNVSKRNKKKKEEKKLQGKALLNNLSGIVMRRIPLRDHIHSMAVKSQDEVVIGCMSHGSACLSLTGERRPYMENAEVLAIAFLTDGSSVIAHSANTCCVYQEDSDGTFIKGMQYECKKGEEEFSLCTDQHDNIYFVNGNPEIYIFHGSNPNPQKVVSTGNFNPKQIHVTKSGVMVTTTFNTRLSTLTVFDQEGHRGTTIKLRDSWEYLYATIDSQDRVLVTTLRDESKVFRLTRYTLQGLSLIPEKKFKEITVHQLNTFFMPVWTVIVSLTPTQLALANVCRQFLFIELPE